MKPSRFSAMLSLLRVADAHLASPVTTAEHIAASRHHLAALERELVAARDASADRPKAVVVAFPIRAALPPGAIIGELHA